MERRSMLKSLFILAALLLCRVQAFSTGPPTGPDQIQAVCVQLLPFGHLDSAVPQEGSGGYLISTDLPLNDDNTGFSYTAGQTYTVTLTGTNTFRGFLVIAHVPGQNQSLLGTFILEPGNANQQLVDCSSVGDGNAAAAIGHSNPDPRQEFESMQFMWQAPDGADGLVNFRYTVVQQFNTFFVAQDAAQNVPAIPTPPVREPEEYQLTFRTPEGCNVSNCTTFVGVDVNEGNGGFLDIYMEGQALGWVAVGFTEEPDIFSADVVACNRIPLNDSIEVLDAFTDASPDPNIMVDDNQDIFLFNGTFIDGRIICTVAKQIAPVDPFPQDIDLSLNLYVLYGVQMAEGSQGMILNNATDIFEISPTPVNPVTGEVVTVPMREPEDYQLTFRTPPGCNVSNCTSFIGVDVNEGNGGFLDIYMEGDALGWVAVGFSESRNMSLADVVACAVNPNTNMVEGLDTYNVPVGRNNVIDEINNVVFFNSSFNESRIFCSVSKLITPRMGVTQDLDLNSFYYVMWGIRADPITVNGSIQPHAIGENLSVALSANLVQPVDGIMIQPPVRAPEDYRLFFRSPANCQPASCDFYIGIDTNAGNDGFLDIYMEAETAGWVAVGFSLTRNMFNADVIGCSLDPAGSGMVEAVDTYNPNARANSLDSIQDITRFNSSASNGRISCVVSKRIAPSGGSEDLNLNDPNLYVMYGIGPTASGAGALSIHNRGAGNPILSTRTFNPATSVGDGSNNFPMGALLRAHGILMLIAWPLLAVSGIFFAAWMRPALPNGEWFQIHRAFLLTSLFVGALGFILAFVAHATNPTPGLINDLGTSTNSVGTAHYIIGIIVMFMHILNPLIAICRCHPGEKYRWVFNLLHGTAIGLLAEILALVNIALGLVRFGPSSFFSDSNELTIFWVYIAYFIFLLVVIGLLFLIFTILSLFNRDEDGAKTAPSLIKPLISSSSGGGKHGPLGEGVELAVPGQKPAAPVDEPEKPKVPSKDSPLRWGALTIFLTVNVIMMLVLLILIALE